jgi:hypothetical protein
MGLSKLQYTKNCSWRNGVNRVKSIHIMPEFDDFRFPGINAQPVLIFYSTSHLVTRRSKSKIIPKEYKVIVDYRSVSEEEAKLKRAIIECLLKKNPKKKHKLQLVVGH